MKKAVFVLVLVFCAVAYMGFLNDDRKPVPIPPSAQRTGNAVVGYKYLITGDYSEERYSIQYFYNGVWKRQPQPAAAYWFK